MIFVMHWVLGFDGGGTKTDCVMASETGVMRARGTAGPSNPFRVGFGAAIAAVREAARMALAEAHATPADISAVCAGLAGTGQGADAEKMRALLAAEFPGALVKIVTDLDLVLAGAPVGDAMVLVAGTGSAAIGRNESGETARIGGHGPMVSDEGSAYDIGRRAVMTAQREFDRAGKDSELGARILREMGPPQWAELRKRIQAAPDEVFPRLFSVVAALADNGDATAQGILRTAAYKLAEMATTLAERLKLGQHVGQRFGEVREPTRGKPFPLVKIGGMIGKSKYFDAQLNERLRIGLPLAEPHLPQVAPADAAAHIAAQMWRAAKASGSAAAKMIRE
jgi:N-acetylglucosamine kinase-like BadF-type ATPase